MSFETDITAIKHLVEDRPLFKPADDATLANRLDVHDVENLIPMIQDEMAADDENDSEKLYDFYMRSSPANKAIIDDTMMYLCGWQLSTLIKRVLGQEDG